MYFAPPQLLFPNPGRWVQLVLLADENEPGELRPYVARAVQVKDTDVQILAQCGLQFSSADQEIRHHQVDVSVQAPLSGGGVLQ